MISEGKIDTLSEYQFFQDSGENKLNPNKIVFRIKVKNPKYIDTDLPKSHQVEGGNPDDFESKPTDVSLRTTSRRNVVDNPNKKTQKVMR